MSFQCCFRNIIEAVRYIIFLDKWLIVSNSIIISLKFSFEIYVQWKYFIIFFGKLIHYIQSYFFSKHISYNFLQFLCNIPDKADHDHCASSNWLGHCTIADQFCQMKPMVYTQWSRTCPSLNLTRNGWLNVGTHHPQVEHLPRYIKSVPCSPEH